jgi:hypothetical protein
MAIAHLLVRWAKNNQIALNNALLHGEKDINYKRSVYLLYDKVHISEFISKLLVGPVWLNELGSWFT